MENFLLFVKIHLGCAAMTENTDLREISDSRDRILLYSAITEEYQVPAITNELEKLHTVRELHAVLFP